MPSSQHLLLKQFLLGLSGSIARRRPTLASMRLAMEVGALGQFLPWGVHLEDTSVEGMPAEWLRPDGAPAHRVLLYFHGGGYVLGSINTHRALVGALAQRCGLNALTIDYRKAPEYPFPAALDDARLAYRWLQEQGYEPQNIILAGDSAGGGLALALLVSLRDAGQALPAAALGLSPWTDLVLPLTTLRRVAHEETQLLEALQMRTWGPHYAGGLPLSHPLLSPVRADLHDLPPLLIQISDAEVLYEDVLGFADKARAAGVALTLQTFGGLVHWWHLFWRVLPEGREALNKAAVFVHGIWEAQAAAHRAVSLAGVAVRTPKSAALPDPRLYRRVSRTSPG
ncbi:alpha/beta hydrolase [Hymenobacter sp. BT175]|uniref:alpha/beta hydrolase n=1 Tax=Hymenobacter translucens TaxID=2886507 RepID=UPI001D0E003F|nr:alpha/beta hydrolase [Hymenobacter translucens]MCC2546679.1 alpha/beta hydrolase [Hymenobacter translucens]